MSQDFTTYIKTDPNNRLVVITSKVNWNGLTTSEDAYLHKDFGEDYFSGDFAIDFELKIESAYSTVGIYTAVFALTNSIDDFEGIKNASGDAIGFYMLGHAAGHPGFGAVELDGGTEWATTGTDVGGYNTLRYCTLVRDESVGTYGTLYFKIYTDAARTNIQSSFTLTLHTSKKDFRYLFIIMTDNTGSGEFGSGYIQNVILQYILTTDPASDILATTATATGTISGITENPITQHGFAWDTSTEPTIAGDHSEEGSAVEGPISSLLTDLTPSTLYYLRAYATTSDGTIYGNEVQFTTLDGSPTLITTLPIYVEQTTAISGGTMSDGGSAPVTEHGICWKISSGPTIADDKTTLGILGNHGVEWFSQATLLTPNTLYYVRAYATNSFGTSYGNEYSFTTDPAGSPTVQSIAIEQIFATEATGRGEITDIGDSAVTEHGYVVDTTINPETVADGGSPVVETTEGVSGVAEFITELTPLTAETDYFARAYAKNGEGTAYGNNIEFTTVSATEGKVGIKFAFGGTIFDPSPTFTDIAWTGDILNIQILRGRMHDLERFEAGTAVIVLKNLDGRYWRLNTSGPYYPNLKPLTVITLAFTYDGVDYDLYYGVIEGFLHSWLDIQGARIPITTITCVDAFKIFKRMMLTALPGEVGAYTNVIAMKANANSGQKIITLKSLGDSLTEGGEIEKLHVGQSITIGDDNASEVNTINGIDANAYAITMDNNLAANYTKANNAYVKKWPAVLSGTRVWDVLYELNWPAALASIDVGQIIMTELVPPVGGTSGLVHLLGVAESEGGILFMGVTGKVVFQDRDARLLAPYNASVATFGDASGQKYVEIELIDDEMLIYNEARISGDFINEMVYRNLTSQAIQGQRTLARTDSLIASDADAFDQAYSIVESHKDSRLRASSMLVLPEIDPTNLWAKALGYEISTRITLQLNAAPNIAGINRDYHIEAIEHNIIPGELWETRWQLWDVNLFRIFQSNRSGYFQIESVVSYATAHDAANSDSVLNDNLVMGIGQSNAGGSDWIIWRAALSFDTSAITAGPDIASAEIILQVTGYFVMDNAWSLTLVDGSGLTNPFAVGDYGTLEAAQTSFGSVTIPAGTINHSIIIITLNAAGIAAINKTGTTIFGLRSSKDISDSAPSGNEQEFLTIRATHANSTFVPRLVVKLNDADVD